jgi:hypothetical protein
MTPEIFLDNRVIMWPDERARQTAKRRPEPPKHGLLSLMEAAE